MSRLHYFCKYCIMQWTHMHLPIFKWVVVPSSHPYNHLPELSIMMTHYMYKQTDHQGDKNNLKHFNKGAVWVFMLAHGLPDITDLSTQILSALFFNSVMLRAHHHSCNLPILQHPTGNRRRETMLLEGGACVHDYSRLKNKEHSAILHYSASGVSVKSKWQEKLVISPPT